MNAASEQEVWRGRAAAPRHSVLQRPQHLVLSPLFALAAVRGGGGLVLAAPWHAQLERGLSHLDLARRVAPESAWNTRDLLVSTIIDRRDGLPGLPMFEYYISFDFICYSLRRASLERAQLIFTLTTFIWQPWSILIAGVPHVANWCFKSASHLVGPFFRCATG